MEWPQQGFQEFVPQNFAPNNVVGHSAQLIAESGHIDVLISALVLA